MNSWTFQPLMHKLPPLVGPVLAGRVLKIFPSNTFNNRLQPTAQ
jgi:hypothetical protein